MVLGKAWNKAKESVSNSISDIREDRELNRLAKKEQKIQYRKGKAEGAYKRGVREGEGKPQRYQPYNSSPRAQRLSGSQGAELLGSGVFGGGLTIDGLGFNLSGGKPKQPQTRTVTKISKTGQVTTIQEPIKDKVQNDDFWGESGSFWGGTATTHKGEKHPYDPF